MRSKPVNISTRTISVKPSGVTTRLQPACKVSAANEQPGRGERSERAEWYSKPPLGRAGQTKWRCSVQPREPAEPALPGRWVRPLEGVAAKPIQGGAYFLRSEFASVPNAASSARNPKGTDVARLFFAYFLLAKQKKVSRPPGRDPAYPRSEVNPVKQTNTKNFFAYFLSAKPKESKSLIGAKPRLLP